MVLKHAIIDIRRAMDWLDQRGKGGPNRIGVAGISMGAIVAALAFEVEPRINSVAILLGGGDIATLLTTSKEDLVVQFREGVMQAQGIGLRRFREEATRILTPSTPLPTPQGVIRSTSSWSMPDSTGSSHLSVPRNSGKPWEGHCG